MRLPIAAILPVLSFCFLSPPVAAETDAAILSRIIEEERLRDGGNYQSLKRARLDGVFDDDAIAFFESFAKTAEAIDELNQSQTIEWTAVYPEAGRRVMGASALLRNICGYFRYLIHLGRETEAIEQIENGIWLIENSRSQDVDPFLLPRSRHLMRYILASAIAADGLELSPENFGRVANRILESWKQEPSPAEVFDKQNAFLIDLWNQEYRAAGGILETISQRARRAAAILTGTSELESVPDFDALIEQRMNSIGLFHEALNVNDYQEGRNQLSELKDSVGETFDSWYGWTESLYTRNRRDTLRMRMLELAIEYVETGAVSKSPPQSLFGVSIETAQLPHGVQFTAEFNVSEKPVILELGDCISFVNSLKQGDLDSVSHWLEAGREVNGLTKANRPPLHLAAANGHLRLVKFLIHEGAQINSTDFQFGLKQPWIRFHPKNLQPELLARYGLGPDGEKLKPENPPNARPLYGETALDAAESNEQTNVSAWLRANGAKTIEELNQERGFKKSEETHRWERIEEEEE